MRRARDVRDQLVGLMERVEIELKTNVMDTVAIRKVSLFLTVHKTLCAIFLALVCTTLIFF